LLVVWTENYADPTDLLEYGPRATRWRIAGYIFIFDFVRSFWCFIWTAQWILVCRNHGLGQEMAKLRALRTRTIDDW